MAHTDPSENALATIASILDKPAQPVDAKSAAVTSERDERPADGTDAPEQAPAVSAKTVKDDQAEPSTNVAVAKHPGSGDAQTDIDNYTRLGPGPLDALRFKWRARRAGDDSFYVDETIGETSRPITTGPFPKDEVVAYIDALAEEALRRFQQLKDEMTVRRADFHDTHSPSFVPELVSDHSQPRTIEHVGHPVRRLA